jgi:hypothetical protein
MDVRSFSKRLDTVEEKVGEMREAAIEHKTRLENGVKVFAKHEARIEEIENKIEPRPPSIAKIVSITITCLIAAATALWSYANMMRDRPTTDQIEKIIHSHDANGHKTMRDDVRAVQTEQAAQRVMIESIQATQATQGKNLDTLVKVLVEEPAEKRKRSRRSR